MLIAYAFLASKIPLPKAYKLGSFVRKSLLLSILSLDLTSFIFLSVICGSTVFINSSINNESFS